MTLMRSLVSRPLRISLGALLLLGLLEGAAHSALPKGSGGGKGRKKEANNKKDVDRPDEHNEANSKKGVNRLNDFNAAVNRMPKLRFEKYSWSTDLTVMAKGSFADLMRLFELSTGIAIPAHEQEQLFARERDALEAIWHKSSVGEISDGTRRELLAMRGEIVLRQLQMRKGVLDFRDLHPRYASSAQEYREHSLKALFESIIGKLPLQLFLAIRHTLREPLQRATPTETLASVREALEPMGDALERLWHDWRDRKLDGLEVAEKLKKLETEAKRMVFVQKAAGP